MRSPHRPGGARAFTLIELMIVVAIIGILAAMAIPGFSRLVRRSKTSEATMNLRRIFDGAVTSYQDDRVTRTGAAELPTFPTTVGPTPGVNACCLAANGKLCPANNNAFDSETWNRIQFSVDDPHYYWYSFDSEGEGLAAQFTARANGNLNCDGIYSTFERIGFIDVTGRIQGSAGIFKRREIE